MSSSYGDTLTYRDGTLRVGCWNCDYVMAAEASDDDVEGLLHKAQCPACGERELHMFGEFGCYPSEAGEPPCRR